MRRGHGSPPVLSEVLYELSTAAHSKECKRSPQQFIPAGFPLHGQLPTGTEDSASPLTTPDMVRSGRVLPTSVKSPLNLAFRHPLLYNNYDLQLKSGKAMVEIIMQYNNIVTGTFIKRPNRFIAHVLIDGRETVCHVKNTGRLREFLLPGASLLLEFHPDAALQGRKTAYSVIGVYKDNAGFEHKRLLINMDSQAPNQAAAEWLAGGGLAFAVTNIKREITYHDSRFDLAFSEDGHPAFMEVKGVTLEQDGAAMFPDAPTERGVKHIMELREAALEGYRAYILFVIQMKGILSFSPNRNTHPEFADALKLASESGVRILARDCIVTEHTMKIDMPVNVIL